VFFVLSFSTLIRCCSTAAQKPRILAVWFSGCYTTTLGEPWIAYTKAIYALKLFFDGPFESSFGFFHSTCSTSIYLRQRGREVQKCAYPHRNFPKVALPRWCYPCMLLRERSLLSILRLACFSIVVCVFPLVPGNYTKSFILDVACENVHISGVFSGCSTTAIEWAVDIYTQAIYALNLFFYCSFRIDVWVFSAHAGTDAK
jgi:hypothetical protein